MGTGLRWNGNRVPVYVFLYYCRGHEWLAEPGWWGGFKVEGD